MSRPAAFLAEADSLGVYRKGMRAKITWWKEPDGRFPGYLNDSPDHWTRGEDFEDLKAHLRDLHSEFSKGDLPGIRRVEEIEV